jgi:tetratricopeptide (TPR) repeat protein
VPRLPFPARLLSRSLVAGSAALVFAGALAAAAPQTDELAAKARQGKEAMAAGRFDEAAALYVEIVQALPNEPGMRVNLGMALSMAGRLREAIPHLQTALKLKPDLLPASLFLGAAYAELGQPAKAVEPLQKVVAAQPDHREARRMLADSLLALERWEPAARHYRALTEQDPGDPRAWYGLGRSYEGLAVRALEALQEATPDSAYVSLLVADALVAQERDKSAFPLYREAIEKKTRVAEAHEALAGIYERSGHADWAATEREKAKAVPPPDCRTPTPECEFRAGRYARVLELARPLGTAAGRYWTSRAAGELAREAFARLAALPPSPEATLVRVQTLRAQRRYAQSKEELQKAVAAWPEDRRIRRELASLLFIAHEQAEARSLLEDLLKQEPDAAGLNLLLGESWLDSKEPTKAVPFLEKAVKADPKLLRARGVLGRAYVEAGQALQAIPHLEAALPTDEDGSLRFQLARAYRETGQAEQATRTLQAFQEVRRANEAREEAEKAAFSITPP